MTIIFPAVLVVVVYFLIQPRYPHNAAPTHESASRGVEYGFRGDAYEQQRALRREVIREVMVERGLIEEDTPEDEVRSRMREMMQGNGDQGSVFAEVRLRLLERDIDPGRWFSRHWSEQQQSPFSPWGVGGFEGLGVTLGDSMPELTLYELQGQAVELSSLWAQRPALIVTGSATNPVTRQRIAELDALSKRFEGRVAVVLVYTTEASPNNTPAPGPAGEALSDYAAERDIPSYPQSTSLEQRTRYATAFRDRLGVRTPILVDAMDNGVWEALGQAPGAAMLVTSEGKVALKQGWLDAFTMAEAIDDTLGSKPVSH